MIVNKYLKIYIDDLKYKQKGDHIMEYVTLNNGLKNANGRFWCF